MQQRMQHQEVANLSREPSASAGSTSALSVLLWLMATAVVAVAGAALLEYEASRSVFALGAVGAGSFDW